MFHHDTSSFQSAGFNLRTGGDHRGRTCAKTMVGGSVTLKKKGNLDPVALDRFYGLRQKQYLPLARTAEFGSSAAGSR